MENITQKTCSNCGSMKFKSWEQLTDDEKFVVARLTNDSDEQKEKQRFCMNCFYTLSDKSIIDI